MTKSKHSPYPEAKRFVQIKNIVLMSDAWRDCDFSARCVYIELAAKLDWIRDKSEPTNNGRLWLSREEWKKAGFAPATVTRAFKQLVAVGLIYRTRRGGIGRGCSEYALTSFPLTKDTNGIFCKGFVKDAWAKYVSPSAIPKKSRESEVNRDKFIFDELPWENGDKVIKFEPAQAIKSEHQESESTNLCSGNIVKFVSKAHPRSEDWMAADVSRIGMAGFRALVLGRTLLAAGGITLGK